MSSRVSHERDRKQDNERVSVAECDVREEILAHSVGDFLL